MSDELNRMVQVFRVHELQILLGFANKNRFGKKNELLARIKDLIARSPSPAFQNKIRELYQKRFPQQDYSSTSRSSGSSHYPLRSQDTTSMMRNSQINGIQRPPGFPSMAAGPMHSQMNNNFGLSSSRGTSGGYTGGTVKPIRLPYFDAMSTLLHPQLLVPRHGEKLHDTYFSFNVDPQHDRHIALNYDKVKTPLPRVEMQLRFFLANSNSEQKDDFPLDCIVRVNDLQVDLPAIIPTNKQGAEPKRLSRPVDITSYYCIRRHKAIRMNITWRQSQDKEKMWMCAVYLVRRVTSNVLLQRLNQIGPSMPEETKTLIRRKLSMDTDSDICTENLRISLLCPLVKVRMTIPGKVRNCSHVQCFDLDSFLKMNEKRPTWVCPVCNKPAPYDQLIIEGYFTEVLEEVRKKEERSGGSRIVEIEVFKAGNWIPITEEQKDREEAAKTAARDKACAVIPDSPTKFPVKAEPSVPKQNNADLIDLCSSDEEEEANPGRPAVSYVDPASVERASSVSSSAPRTPVHSANNGVRSAREPGECSSSSSSNSESRNSPSIIVLDSPPSHPTASSNSRGNSEDLQPTVGKRPDRTPVSSQPPKKRFQQSDPEEFRFGAGGSSGGSGLTSSLHAGSSVICGPSTSIAESSAALPTLSEQRSTYPSSVPRIMGTAPTTSASAQSQLESAITSAMHNQFRMASLPSASSSLPQTSMAPGNFYGNLPTPFSAPYYQQMAGNFFPPGFPGFMGYPTGAQAGNTNDINNYQNDEALLGALEQNANVNYMEFLNRCMEDSERILQHK